jgi:hypothetical protein
LEAKVHNGLVGLEEVEEDEEEAKKKRMMTMMMNIQCISLFFSNYSP